MSRQSKLNTMSRPMHSHDFGWLQDLVTTTNRSEPSNAGIAELPFNPSVPLPPLPCQVELKSGPHKGEPCFRDKAPNSDMCAYHSAASR